MVKPNPPHKPRRNKGADDAKLIFGTVFSLRNMVRKLGGDDDAFISYRTAHYKLHYYETPTNLRFAMLTEPGALSMRNVLHQIYINLWVEYGQFCSLVIFVCLLPPPSSSHVRMGLRKGISGPSSSSWRLILTFSPFLVVKNPLSPVEHKGGDGVRNEMFELGLDKFIRGLM
jgi:hypothetical protein